MQNDTLADALSLIKNAERAGKRACDVSPASRLLGAVLEVMQDGGYIQSFEHVDDGRGGIYRITLSGHINDCGAIKPRFSIRRGEFPKWESRYLPAEDFGALILTTTAGVVSNVNAKEMGTGGKLLAFVY